MTSQDKTFPNDIVQLSRSRAAFKGKLTQFTNFIDNLATPLTADDILNLEFRIENVTSTYEKFDTIQMQLECLSEDTSSQLLEREKFEELYFESLAKAKGLVMAFRNDNDEPEAKPSHSSECIDSIKFPEIALPSFSGDFREWLEFRETFDALINQSSLKSIQKFKYLRSCLKDGALEVVNSIEYTSDGYQMAWRLLCERYNNPRLLVSNHLRSLFEIPSISSENAKSLRALIDNINKHLRSLHTLNIPIDDWDLIIIYFMSNKLPSSLQRSWEENQSSNVLPSLQDFKNFIRRRADILDNLNVTKPGGPEARKSLVTTSSKPIVNPSCPQCKAHIKLADENFSSAGEVDLLIGAELFYNLLCFGRHSLGEGCPILQKTKLGWIVSGSLASPIQVRCNLSLKTQLKHFWEMEECGDNPFTPHNDQVSYDDKVCEKVFMTHTRNAEGNFVIQLPFKFPISNLGQSKHIAQQRFHSLERKFSKNDEFKQMYIQFMREFEQTGRMEKCTSSDVPLNFLPHHAVVNLEKSTTPLRVVFDASCPTSSGYSPNDILHKGTIKQDTLNHILLRFRLHKYVINADIRKMFCCIHINADQQPLQCILWREEPHHELQTFKLTTLSFGLKPAPHIATRCLLHLAQETRTALQQLPDAARSSAELPVAAAAAAAIEEQFYADDLLLSGDDEHRITQVALEVDRVLRTANFHLRLETHSFLSAFRRFIARRGKPRVVVSDNGTTFRGADRELRELYDFLNTNSNELTTSCTEQGIEWKFVPSYSPHMNGLAEGAVKSCKYHLKRVLKQSLLTYEGFSTILIQIEGILNSRPLCPIPFSDSEIFQVLTPAHFLIGRTPVALPDYQYDEVPTNRLKYFQQLQQIYQSFWKGFSRDYVGLLQQRGKWQSSKGPTLAAGSVVLIKDKHTPPCQWRLARIIETHPGGDGVTRVATLKTSQGSTIKLSFPKICPLPILDNN
ncbi:uncharacterized protein LOC135086343 isoform X2 [Ostrinia nubilalis]|uniref:uncharacterized protein LOC135086343 isoform X2 n=1 Tax=Ostrinia nubilalis TaxID=29057 RepID=UPI0030825D06